MKRVQGDAIYIPYTLELLLRGSATNFYWCFALNIIIVAPPFFLVFWGRGDRLFRGKFRGILEKTAIIRA